MVHTHITILDVGPMYTVHGAHTYYKAIIVVTMVQRLCPVTSSLLIFLLLQFYFCFVSLKFLFRVFLLFFLFNLYSCFGLLLALMLLSQHANKRQLN